MQKTRTITPGQRLHQYSVGTATWDRLDDARRAEYEQDAKRLGIQPRTENVTPPTDGELFEQAMLHTRVDCGKTITHRWEESAAEFLRLVRERDGEPLPVPPGMVNEWLDELCDGYTGFRASDFADRINAHRGVRPELPKVKAAMFDGAYDAYHKAGRGPIGYIAAADYLNAELAKLAGKDGAS